MDRDYLRKSRQNSYFSKINSEGRIGECFKNTARTVCIPEKLLVSTDSLIKLSQVYVISIYDCRDMYMSKNGSV